MFADFVNSVIAAPRAIFASGPMSAAGKRSVAKADLAASTMGELSDADLEHVVGGLARTIAPAEWLGGSANTTNAPL